MSSEGRLLFDRVRRRVFFSALSCWQLLNRPSQIRETIGNTARKIAKGVFLGFPLVLPHLLEVFQLLHEFVIALGLLVYSLEEFVELFNYVLTTLEKLIDLVPFVGGLKRINRVLLQEDSEHLGDQIIIVIVYQVLLVLIREGVRCGIVYLLNSYAPLLHSGSIFVLPRLLVLLVTRVLPIIDKEHGIFTQLKRL